MCELCGEEKEAANYRKGLLSRAEDIKKFAYRLESLASGKTKPHSDETKRLMISARAIIRYLVEDWL